MMIPSIRPMAAITCRHNGPLIAIAAMLYIRPDDAVLDPTYGRGKWWTVYRPVNLTARDRDADGSDFRVMPEPDGTYDVVAFDPPYVPQGGRDSSTEQEFLSFFGLHNAVTSPALLRELNRDGLREIFRVLKPGGVVLAKSMNYVSSGAHHPQVAWLTVDAEEIGFRVETQFIHVSGTGPQPKRARILSPRANYSVLVVLRKPPQRRRPSSR